MDYNVLKPDYYPAFFCTGSDCAYNCCHGWSIDLSRADYTKIRSAKKDKALEATLKEGMKRNKDGTDDKYAHFVTENKACAMLRDDGLCELQAQCGYEALPRVCKIFPRITTVAGNTILQACTAGCIEVMKELMQRQKPLTFLREAAKPNTRFQTVSTLSSEYHPQLRHYDKVLEICVDLLQNHVAPLRERVLLLGMALRELDELEQVEKSGGPQKQPFAQWAAKYKAAAASGQRVGGLDTMLPDAAVLASINFMLSQLNTKGRDQAMEAVVQDIMQTLQITYYAKQQAKQEEQTQEAQGDAQDFRYIMQYEGERYTSAREALYAACDVDGMLENIMVNFCLTSGAPFAHENMWQDYLYFCQLYSFLHFAAVACFARHQTLEQLARELTVCYRKLVHSDSIREKVLTYMANNDCTTLAHMAVLVSG